MGILNETLGALQVEYTYLSLTDTEGRAAKEALGNRVFDLITEADEFMAGVRRYAAELSAGGPF